MMKFIDFFAGIGVPVIRAIAERMSIDEKI